MLQVEDIIQIKEDTFKNIFDKGYFDLKLMMNLNIIFNFLIVYYTINGDIIK